jgi:hypothetical protein
MACPPADGHGTDAENAAAAATVVDSIRPLAEELRLFRATLPDHPDRLSAGASSIDELVGALVTAVNAGDAEGVARLALTRSEFAYFHYPHTRFTSSPYELSPALVWYQLVNHSGRGMTRLFTTFESRHLLVGDTTCEDPAPFGAGWVHDCIATVLDANNEWVDVRIFGSILERDGRFKFVSFANDL